MGDAELTQLEWDLTANALAFLRRSFRQTIGAEEDVQLLSFAVVDLAVATEVLLKARLVREHWTLILDGLDTGKPDRATIIGGSAKTVTPGQAVDRLNRLIGLPLGEANDKKSRAHQVSQLTNLRNRAAHFTLASMQPLSIRARLGVGLQFVLWLLENEFPDSPAKNDIDALLTDLRNELGEVQELVRARMQDLAVKLDRATVCVECPRCSQPTLMLSLGEEPVCPFCRSVTSATPGSQLAEEYVDEVLNLAEYQVVKDGGEWPIYDCPKCGETSLVGGVRQLRPSLPDGESSELCFWGCFSCGLTEPVHVLDHCHYCFRLCDGGYGLCIDCSHQVAMGDL